MSETTTQKRTTRTRKTPVVSVTGVVTPPPPASAKTQKDPFAELIAVIESAKETFESLQKEIALTRETWEKEQQQQVIDAAQKNNQEEVERKREKETYEYETAKRRRMQEDEFNERKAKWERDLQTHKDELEAEKKELLDLRKQVADFTEEKEEAVKDARSVLQKTLMENFTTEKRMREQEIKAEKELLVLKITNLTQENSRQTAEISALKKSLEEATRELKDVAVRVIDSANMQKTPSPAAA